jgi:uncharacterized protein (DUF488 family)
MRSPVIFTIGHSTHPIERFTGLLNQHRIETLVDVRSVPYSRFNPQYRKRSLEAALDTAGISYVYLGDSLGGRPGESRGFKERDLIDYAEIARQPWYLDGIEELLEIARQSRCAIMCSEEPPSKCHRTLLIGNSLISRSLARVVHIRGDGSLEPGKAVPHQSPLL